MFERADGQLHEHADGRLVVVESIRRKAGRRAAALPRGVEPLDGSQAALAHFVQDRFEHHGQVVAVARRGVWVMGWVSHR
jgi:hypothetical protein